MQKKGEASLTLRSSSVLQPISLMLLKLWCRPEAPNPKLSSNATMCMVIPVICVLAADLRLIYPVAEQPRIRQRPH